MSLGPPPPSALNFWRKGLKNPPPPADPTPVLIGAGLGLIFLSLSVLAPLLCLPVVGESRALPTLEVGEIGSGPAVATASNRAAMTGYEIMSPVTCWIDPDRELLCGAGRGKDAEVGEGVESSSEGEESELCGSGGRAGRFGGVENVVPRLFAGRSARSTRRGQHSPCVVVKSRSPSSETHHLPQLRGVPSGVRRRPTQDQPVLAVQPTHSCLPPCTSRSAAATKKQPDHLSSRRGLNERRVPEDRHECRISCGVEQELVAPSSMYPARREPAGRRPQSDLGGRDRSEAGERPDARARACA